MRVVALKAWSNGSISMEERQIAELPDALATSLIAQRIVAPTALPEITDADDGKVLTADSGVWVAANPSSGGGVLVVTDTEGTLDKTWQEIHDAPFAMLVNVRGEYGKECAMLSYMGREGRDEPYSYNITFGDDASYTASSADGYPAAT